MANEENLIPFTSEQSRELAKKNGSKGGKASAEARKKRKAMKEQMEMLLNLPLKDEKTRAFLESMGIDTASMDNQMALVVSTFQNAIRGDMKAVNIVREIIGERVQEISVTQVTDAKVKELEAYLNAKHE